MKIADCRLPIADFRTFGTRKNWQLAIGNRQLEIGNCHEEYVCRKLNRYLIKVSWARRLRN